MHLSQVLDWTSILSNCPTSEPFWWLRHSQSGYRDIKLDTYAQALHVLFTCISRERHFSGFSYCHHRIRHQKLPMMVQKLDMAIFSRFRPQKSALCGLPLPQELSRKGVLLSDCKHDHIRALLHFDLFLIINFLIASSQFAQLILTLNLANKTA